MTKLESIIKKNALLPRGVFLIHTTIAFTFFS